MTRYVKQRGHRIDRSGAPGLPKVEKAELSEKNIPLRTAVAAAAFLIGIAALVNGFMKLVRTESGWQEITVSSDADLGCSSDFTLNYNLGQSGISAAEEAREIQAVYGEACTYGYRVFNTDLHFDDVTNIFDLNHSLNQTITVDDTLYQMFVLLDGTDSRLLYYGPLYEYMDNLYICQTDSEAKEYDPVYNSEIAEDFTAILSYANDSNSVQVELLGNNRICLKVSEEYQALAKEYGFEKYIDPGLMKNAFLTDYLADTLIENGYTNGTLSSYDGYCRYLDGGEEGAAFTIYRTASEDQEGTQQTKLTAETETAPSVDTLVSLRNFPLQENDAYNFYEYENGEIRSRYLGKDGYCHAAAVNLAAYSADSSCAKVLLLVLPVYINDSIDTNALASLESLGIYTVY